MIRIGRTLERRGMRHDSGNDNAGESGFGDTDMIFLTANDFPATEAN